MSRRLKFTAPKARLDRYAIDKATALHARAFNTDPFAGPRVRLHMIQGIELPLDIIAAAEAKLDARGDKFKYLG